jgi:hypothetical protein
MVAWCTKPGHGTRLIPADALQGVQFMKTPDYVQVVGFVDQTKINILEGDWGGEMDPHGADLVRPAAFRTRRLLTIPPSAWKPPRWVILFQRMEQREDPVQAGDRMAQVRIPPHILYGSFSIVFLQLYRW